MRRALRTGAGVYLGVLAGFLLAGLFHGGEGLTQNVNEILQSPNWHHPFGTDDLGRDLFWRVVQGGQVSVAIGLLSTALAFAYGLLYGATSGWFGGAVDRWLMRAADLLLAIPSFIMVALFCLLLQQLFPEDSSLSRRFTILIVAIASTHWMNMARLSRALVLEIKGRPFIEAARSLGGASGHILCVHVLPNIMDRLLVLAALQVPANIMYESYMSFIGLGIQPPWTSWGLLLQDGWKTLSAFPHLLLLPSAILFLTVWSFHLLLDARRS